MTVTFSITVTTADPHPGADPVDAITADLIGRGFTLLTGHGPPALQPAPELPGWWADLHQERLQITAHGETFYDGDLGPAVPHGWHHTARARGRLTILTATELDLQRPDRGEQTHHAMHAGRLVAAQARVRAGDSPPSGAS
ncbi:hypothetical protein [Pseudonocardia sp. NPDC049635]|uniref:hypothetical protein n=1 Tax=Pseudonocardia sp. NPDC049635 TaxID=3155506 RepID=UPI003407BBD3